MADERLPEPEDSWEDYSYGGAVSPRGLTRRHMARFDEEIMAGAREHTSRWEATQLVGRPRGKEVSAVVDVRTGRFPCCIVWTSLPGITALFPFIGHLGIADSRGVVYDFAGPYSIGVDNLSFGRCQRFLRLDPALAAPGQGLTPAQVWDAAIDSANSVYCERMHNIFCDNCHSHVARALNSMVYGGHRSWGMVRLVVWVLLAGEWTTVSAALWVWGTWGVLIILVLALRYGMWA